MARYVGAVDQGTTSTRALVFDDAGTIRGSAGVELQQHYPRPGWVEHDPEEIWQRTEKVIARAMQDAGVTPGDVAAIGITNQRETTVVWDRKTGKPLHNAIVWQDTRVAADVAQFSAQGGKDRYRATTGLPLATYFSGLKIRWLLNNVPDLRARAEDVKVQWVVVGLMRRY